MIRRRARDHDLLVSDDRLQLGHGRGGLAHLRRADHRWLTRSHWLIRRIIQRPQSRPKHIETVHEFVLHGHAPQKEVITRATSGRQVDRPPREFPVIAAMRQVHDDSHVSNTTVEQRVSALERTAAELVQSRRSAGRVKDWRRTAGMFSGNELMKEIDAAGAKLRAQDRQRPRRRGTKRRRTGK